MKKIIYTCAELNTNETTYVSSHLYKTIRLFSFMAIVLLLTNTRTATTTTKLFAMIATINTEIPLFSYHSIVLRLVR